VTVGREMRVGRCNVERLHSHAAHSVSALGIGGSGRPSTWREIADSETVKRKDPAIQPPERPASVMPSHVQAHVSRSTFPKL